MNKTKSEVAADFWVYLGLMLLAIIVALLIIGLSTGKFDLLLEKFRGFKYG